MRRLIPIILCLTLLLSGCVQELVSGGDRCLSITVVCEDPVLTKAEKPGVDAFNENRVSWVDFFFYPLGGEENMPDEDTPASFHVRKTPNSQSAGAFTFNMDVSLEEVNQKLFPGETQHLYVFAVVNYGQSLDDKLVNDEDLANTSSLSYLRTIKVTGNFAEKHTQDRFLMSGSQTLTLISKEKYQVSSGTIELKRYAAKMTVALHVEEGGVSVEGANWFPMLEGMEVFLCDGVKTVCLSGRDSDPEYFDYSPKAQPGGGMTFATLNSLDGTVTPKDKETREDGKVYYNTDPMYMYPQIWKYGQITGKKVEPYLKVVVPWYRPDVGDVTFAQRQCYYKVMMPFAKDPEKTYDDPDFDGLFERNNWYHLDVDIKILGALTEDNAVLINNASCFIGTWQNSDEHPRSHLADVGMARYLSVERDNIVLRNVATTDILYVSSHTADFKTSDFRATRRYYGTKTEGEQLYKDNPNVIICVAQDNDIYPKGTKYLDYHLANEWFGLKTEGTKTVVEFNHKIDNNYKNADFDYSPYTITFTLKHKDLGDGVGIEKTVTIVQYPAIYIDALSNSDADYCDPIGTTKFYEKANQTTNPTSVYWGYVFVDGGAYRPENWSRYDEANYLYRDDAWVNSDNAKWVSGVRQTRLGYNDPMFFKLKDADPANQALMRQEYQWRTIWYTGGSLDMFQINVSVLNAEDNKEGFIIGDPRCTTIDNLNYKFESPNPTLLPSRPIVEGEFTGFEVAPSLDRKNGQFEYNEQEGKTTKRGLRYYYPTESSSRTKNLLAPSYRISSKFGGVEFSGERYGIGDVEKRYAEYRCATYQEDGFPAGRWRLPTKGEIKFIAQLSANGVFATLFTNNRTYWSANGPIKISGRNVEETNDDVALLRCVYDTWYWGEDRAEYDEWRMRNEGWWDDSKTYEENIAEIKTDSRWQRLRNTFVWGDRPK